MAREEQEFAIQVPSTDPEKKTEKKQNDGKKANGDAHDAKKDKADDDLSEEDLQLKNELEMLVERLRETEKTLHRPALESLRSLIRTSTSSMTSVPKPLKFLRPHFTEMKQIYDLWQDSTDKALFAEILSVLAMTYSDNGQRETLHFRLRASKVGQAEDPGLWGHEYVRHLASELGEEYNSLSERDQVNEQNKEQLMELALLIVPFSLKHNAEADAVDLLLELEAIAKLPQFVDKDTYARACLYMVSCVNLLVPPDDVEFLRTAHEIYRKFDRFGEAMTLALRLGDRELIRSDFEAPQNPVMRRQLAYMLGRQNVPIEWLQDEDQPITDQEILDCIYNTQLSKNLTYFGKELGVAEAKSLEDIYKSHLDSTRTTIGSSVDSARGNLASTFVNAFVNAGYGNDPLLVEAEDGNSWIYKNKDYGMLSASASLGLSLLWDTDLGLSHIDKYSYSSDENIKAGSLMAYGILHANVRTEMDAPIALLAEHVENGSKSIQMSAIVGLGIAYAGSWREDIVPLLLQHVADESTSMDIASISALALGMIFVGSSHGEITPTILQTLMEREPSQLDDKWARFMSLGLALLFLGQQDSSDATIETLKAIEHPISKQTQVLVDMCSYAGTGNVLKVQTMLHHCTEHLNVDEKKDEEDEEDEASESKDQKNKSDEQTDDLYQAFAVLGVALVTMGEDVGAEMALRHMSHMMHYGEPVVRKSVPLALALLNPSNPQMSLVDTLSKYSHDNDLAVAVNSILAMGIVGAGTNNARLGQMLRQLANYYHKESNCLFMVRVAQGLVHMGKGTIGINPYHTDRQLMSKVAICGILSTLVSFTDAYSFVLDRSQWMLFYLVNAMYPRFLITVDESLQHLPTSVRVGQAVDVVGQAGKPRTITGFQTHTSPVRIGALERAELATDEYLSYSNVLEGVAILRKNPGYQAEE